MAHTPASQDTGASCFVIQLPQFDQKSAECKFSFRLDGHTFNETLHFPQGHDPEIARSPQFLRLLNIGACVLGISYYKLLAPLRICSPDFELSQTERSFVLDLYENGLGEFFARNKLHRFGKIQMPEPVSPTAAPPASVSPLVKSNKALVLIGGGKDSLVSVQLVEKSQLDFTPFAVNPKGPILSSMTKLEQTPLCVKRKLDPEMIRLSKTPGYLNGHVPSTAINSMIAALAALLFGYGTIILSNERSASQGNVLHDGREVNHQYSKSLAFETAMRQLLGQSTHGQLEYFSLLRPYSELRIAEMFAQNTRFDLAFASCNKNFTLQKHTGARWCCTCPKCHFVFLILAPFMTPKRLTAIFGGNILSQPEHINSFRRLAGLEGQKPWECVGEILEAAASLNKLSLETAWNGCEVVSTLGTEVRAFYGAEQLQIAWNEMMQDSTTHFVPPFFASGR